MLPRLALSTALALCQLVSPAQAQSAAMNQGQMDRLDRDRNGAVDRSEYQAFMTMAFASLDKNKDGSLRSDEVAQALTAQQFAATDKNGDGRVSQTEFLNRVMADFQAADRSGDGNLE